MLWFQFCPIKPLLQAIRIALASFLAIADLFFGDRALARAAPPSLPNATAAGLRLSSLTGSDFSPVAMSTMLLARWFTSLGRFDFGMPPRYDPRPAYR